MKIIRALFFVSSLLTIMPTHEVLGQTLYWDPGTDGTLGAAGVSGNWSPAGVGSSSWRLQTGVISPSGSVPITSGLGAAQQWSNGANAVFGNAGAPSGTGNEPGPVTLSGLGTYPISASSIKFDAPGYVVTTTSVGRTFSTGSLVNNYATQITLNASTPGNATFTATAITGSGTLTLNNTSSAAANLLLQTATSTSTPFQISGASTGVLTGLVATADLTLTGNVTSNVPNVASANRTLLAAQSTKTLTIGTGSTVSSLGVTTQIGTSTNTGTVAVNGGDILTPIDVVGGTLLVSSAITSTNITVESGAKLALGASNVLSNSASLTLSGGVFQAGGFTDTLASLTLTANSVIDFSGAAGSLTFSSIDVSTWGASTLSIWNWSQNVDHLFASSVTGFTPFGFGSNAQYTPKITFYSDNGITQAPVGWTGIGGWFPTGGNFAGTTALPNEIIPVPEPSAVLSAALLILAVAWKERRHFVRARSCEPARMLAA